MIALNDKIQNFLQILYQKLDQHRNLYPSNLFIPLYNLHSKFSQNQKFNVLQSKLANETRNG